ncbi:MAG: membrane protein insertase YidC, partial [Myxococcota bacterium]
KSKGCVLKATPTGYMHLSFQRPQEDLAPGQSTTFEMKAFFGPKYYNRLEQVGGRLDSSVDFGIFAFISKPMLWLMQTFYDGMGKVGMANWGLAIIFLTLLVKLLMWIPTSKQMESMKKMSKLKPQMDKLKEKYGDDKESIQRETMALYSREGVNPLGGCLPMLLQMPIWLALYNTLYYAVELYQAPFIPGWINDLSVRDPIFVLPITLGVLMFLQQKMTPTTGMDGTQAQIMQIFMPVFFTAIMLFLPSGLTLYILVNTLIGIIHQWIVYNQPDKPVDPKKKRKPSWLERMNQYVEEQQKKASS